MTSFLLSVWSFLKDNDRPLLILFALVGGIYTLIEFRSKVNSDKELATSRFVEAYGAAELLKARIDFNAFMNSAEVRALRPGTYDAYMQGKTDDERVFRDVESLLTFFDSLSVCAISNSCSQDTSCRYFFTDVEGFIKNTRPILAELSRRDNEPVDQLIRKFAHDICREHLKTYCIFTNFAGKDCSALRPKVALRPKGRR